MVTYPIKVRRERYSGGDRKKMAKVADANRQATALENGVNELLLKQTAPIQTYLWDEIVSYTKLSKDVVKNLGYSIDCGSNGFTAWRHDLTYEQAIESIK